MGKNQIVGPNGKDGWKVKGEGNSKATSHHPTQKEAFEAGRKIAKNQNSELKLQDRNGKFTDRGASYGNDPPSSKG